MRHCCADRCESGGKIHIKPSEIVRVGVERGYEVGLREKSFAIQPKDAPRGSFPKIYTKQQAIALLGIRDELPAHSGEGEAGR